MIRRGDQQFGPYAIEQVREYFAAGRLLSTDLALRVGATAWEPLFLVVQNLTPPPPPPPPPPFASAPPPFVSGMATNPIRRDYPNEPQRYQRAFKRFDSRGGQFAYTANPWPFVFGVIWYFYKGLWKKALLYGLISIVLAASTAGIGWLLWSFFFMVIGNYDYYLLRTQGKDFGW